MKKYLIILQAAICLLSSSASYAIHQSISDTNTIQYCGGFCTVIDSLEVGSIFTLNGDLDTDPNGEFPDDLLTTLIDYSIDISGATSSLLLTPSNTTLLSSNIFTSTDEFETTTIVGGTANFDTTNAFAALMGVPSELIYNFDNNSINFFINGDLTASTTVVPIPNAFLLFFSGIMLLTSIARKKPKV